VWAVNGELHRRLLSLARLTPAFNRAVAMVSEHFVRWVISALPVLSSAHLAGVDGHADHGVHA
jgi:hypothetical protein